MARGRAQSTRRSSVPADSGNRDQPIDWGASPRLSAFETLTWRIEADPRLRSTLTLVDILDSPPEWDRLVAAHDWGTRMVPRFRQRVVEPALPVGPAQWAVDPTFDLSHHLQRVRIPSPGSLRQVLDLAQDLAMAGFDRTRPPWDGTLVEGLEGGRAAYILKLHHSATDGMGGIQLLSQMHSRTTEHNPDKPQPPAPAPRHVTSGGLLVDEVTRGILGAPAATRHAAAGILGMAARAVGRPDQAIEDSLRLLRSAQRMLTPPSSPPSPLLARRSATWHFEAHELPLAELRAAAKSAGGSVNDAYLAALLGAFRLYHEEFGVEIDWLPIAIPISLRTSDDPMGGNKFAGARFAAPVGEVDPGTRVRKVREFVLSAREDAAQDAMAILAPLLYRLPTALLVQLVGQAAKGHDLQASNVPGIGHPVYLAGARITHMFPFGPLGGSAAMASMVSHNGTCCIGVNLDPSAVTDPEAFARCLRAGFDEVLGLGPQSTPA